MLDAQWRDADSLTCLPLRGQRRDCARVETRARTGFPFHPFDRTSQGHLKRAQYGLGIELLSIVQSGIHFAPEVLHKHSKRLHFLVLDSHPWDKVSRNAK